MTIVTVGNFLEHLFGTTRVLSHAESHGSQLTRIKSSAHKPLSSGTRLGPYEILSPIGATALLAYRKDYAPAADGLKFLVATVPEDKSTVPLEIVLNWAAGIGKP